MLSINSIKRQQFLSGILKEESSPRTMSYTSRYSGKYRNNPNYPFHKSLTKEEAVDLNEINPEEVQIPKEYIHNKLNQQIWDNNQLRPDVKKALMKIAKEFYIFLDIKTPMDSIKFVGSMANYNWSSQSDIDLHIFFDFKKISSNTELVKNLLDSKKNIWNEEHNIKIKGFDVELYCQDIDEVPISSGVYNLSSDQWENEPTFEKFSLDRPALITKIVSVANLIDDLENSDQTKESIYQRGENLKIKIKKMRQSGLEEGGEFSLENLCFKYLRNHGYIEKLYNMTKNAFDKNLSIAESTQPKMNNNKHQLIITKSADNLDESKIKLIAEFIKFCCKTLGIQESCKVVMTGKRGGPIQTTASYNPNNDEIYIYVKNRNMLADPLRSLAHEIRHFKQKLDNVLVPTSGDDGSPHEDEAHCFSGLMIRLFGKSHPEIFN